MNKIIIIIIVFILIGIGFLSGCNSNDKIENTYNSKDNLNGNYLDENNDTWIFNNGILTIDRNNYSKQDVFYDIFNVSGSEILVIFDYYDLKDFENISNPYYNFYRDANFTMTWINNKTLQLNEVNPLILDHPLMIVLQKQ